MASCKSERSPAKVSQVIFQTETAATGEEGLWLIRIPAPVTIGTATWKITVEDGNGAVGISEHIFRSNPKPDIRGFPKSVTISTGHSFRYEVNVIGDVEIGGDCLTFSVLDPRIISSVDGVSLERAKSSGVILWIRSQSVGKTTLNLVVRDVRGATSMPINIDVRSVSGPTIGFLSGPMHLLGKPGETRSLKFAVSGYGTLKVSAKSDNQGVVTDSGLRVDVRGGDGTLTVKFGQVAGTSRVTLTLSDANGAEVYGVVQCDIYVEKRKSRHQKWRELRKRGEL